MSLTREQILKPVEIPKQEIYIPEIGGTVWVKGMSAADRSRFEKEFQTSSGQSSKRKLSQIRERLVIACVCNEEGSPILTVKDVEALGKQSIQIIERIVNVAQKLCGMSSEDVEQLAGNSEETAEDS